MTKVQLKNSHLHTCDVTLHNLKELPSQKIIGSKPFLIKNSGADTEWRFRLIIIPRTCTSLSTGLTTKKNPENELQFLYPFEDFCSFIRGAEEKTSASPSGRHYGHCKVLLRNCRRLLFDVYKVMKIAFMNGIFLERYKRTVTTLIAKEKGRPRIHRLRPIHIVEIELQALSKSQWAKKFIKRAERNNMITDSQYGGRALR